MPLREACEHGRYETHHVSRGLNSPYMCDGRRGLSDAEALRALLFDTCGECEGDPHKIDRWTCHVCGGSGVTPRDGVEPRFSDAYASRKPEGGYFIDADLLEGDKTNE